MDKTGKIEMKLSLLQIMFIVKLPHLVGDNSDIMDNSNICSSVLLVMKLKIKC